jgi:hypothetical protein
MPKLQLKNVNSVTFNKHFTKTKKSRERFNLIPLSVDTNYYGKLIINTDDFTSLSNKINHQRDLLNQSRLSLDKNCKIYLYNDSFTIISVFKGDNTYYRSVYDAKLGVLINGIKDTIVSDSNFIRTTGHVSLTIVDNNIVKAESLKVLSPIS